MTPASCSPGGQELTLDRLGGVHGPRTGHRPRPGDEVNQAFTITTRSGNAIIRTPVPPFKWWRGLQARKTLEDYFTARVAERRDAEGTDMLTVLCHTTDDDGNSSPTKTWSTT
jgi:cytochrome P450